MKKRKVKFSICILVSLILLIVSIFYRVSIGDYISSIGKEKDYSTDPNLKGKTIVRVWIRKDNVSSTRGYQVQKFNEENKDIYVMLSMYKEDYDNLLKTAIAADRGPDIMTYAYFELIKDNKLANLKDLDLNLDKVGKENLVYYNGEPFGTRSLEQNVKFIWNKEIFKKAGLNPEVPPKTWSEVLAYSKIIKEKCKDVLPLQFPLNDYQDFKASIGEPSANSGNIYTTFWDYKKGSYEFSYAKDILSTYNKLYSEGMLDTNFYNKSRNELRTDFYKGNVAMFLSTYEDKGYFSNIIPLDFDLGISDLPKVKENQGNDSYFLTNSNFLSINSEVANKSPKEKEAITKVYNWLNSQEVNKGILKTKMAISPLVKDTNIKDDVYKEFNNVKNCKTEEQDPSIFISRDSKDTINLSIDAITGKKSVDEVIKSLNDNYKNYCEFTEKYRKTDMKKFKK
ncbi:ABC transporter substrate-binding protein [Haloimpatiens sp. FM7315]|uniref:ABC transporter substrate-binding protein n=1 Tax=Haloimpatiens sp. FM7315 TaxID=3298609 RepID=UPI0035A2A49F